MVNEIVPSSRCRCCECSVDPTAFPLDVTRILFHCSQFCAHQVRMPAINHCLLFSFDVPPGKFWLLSSHSSQSSPKSSTGCCVRIVPFPQRRSSAEQYLSHPQQIRSGCFGLSATFVFGTPALSCIATVVSRPLLLSEKRCPA